VRSIVEFGGIGDGKSDNGAAFQKALTSLEQNGGGVLTIPGGVFLTSSTISFASSQPISVQGAGAYLSVISYTGKGDGIFVGPDLRNVPEHLFLHLGLHDLQLRGTPSSQNGIHIVDASEFVFDNIVVREFGLDGLHARQPSMDTFRTRGLLSTDVTD
jgi:polygalacturonase